MRLFAGISFFCFLCCLASTSFAQIRPDATSDTLEEFEILHAQSLRSIYIDSATTLQTASGKVEIQQEGNKFYADSAVLNPVAHTLEAFGNIHINQGDTIHTYGQYLKYLGEQKKAYIERNVRLTDGKGTLVTREMDYDLDLGIGNFYKGGKVTEGKNVITSENGTYYADTKDVYFKKNVVVTGEKNLIKADSLLYNMETKISSFISPTYIKNNEVELTTTQGTYDLKTENALFTERTNVTDSSGRRYSANNMALEGESGNVQLEGNAVVIDTANNFMLLANQIFMNRNNNSFLATRKPLLIVKQENDSTFIAADTIFSGLKINMLKENPASVLQEKEHQDEKVEELILTDSANFKGDQSVKDSLEGENPDQLAEREKPDSISIETIADSLKSRVREDSLPLKGDVDSLELRRSADSTTLEKELYSSQLRKPVDSLTAGGTDSISRKEIFDSLSGVSMNDSLPLRGKSTDSLTSTSNKDSLAFKHSLSLLGNDLDTLSSENERPVAAGRNDRLVSENDTLPLPERKDSLSLNVAIIPSPVDTIKRDSAVNDSTIRYFIAFHNVRIFNDSLQGASDSLYFTTEDSVFRMYKEPVLWSGQTQITGDTLYLFTHNKKPERLYVFDKGMIVNRTREGFFNQMAGKTINGYFVDGKIDYMRVKGAQSQSIYYMQDEDSLYIGMNKAVADVIDMYFKNDDLQKVAFVNEVNGKMYPMGQIPEEERKLPDFKWLDDRRPKSKFELYE